MHEVAVLVAQELDFDVPGPLDVLLEEDIGDAEGRAGLALGLIDGIVELIGAERHAHAAAAASHRGLDDERESRASSPACVPRPCRRPAHRRPIGPATLASWASLRAASLSPSISRTSARGPTKMMPAS